MTATAVSNISSIICVTMKRGSRRAGILGPWFPSRVRRRCPAIMFAASRTARVPGRMVLLTVSIHTMNDISAGGVPWGTR